MSHTTIIVSDSLLDIFDPNLPEYAGTREHYSAAELSRIDEIRNRTPPVTLSFDDRIFICWALDKAVMTATNP